jgi:hypothetical protein
MTLPMGSCLVGIGQREVPAEMEHHGPSNAMEFAQFLVALEELENLPSDPRPMRTYCREGGLKSWKLLIKRYW